MSLKSRMAKLSRGREQVLLVNALPTPFASPDVGILPPTPKQDGETDAAWYARLHALGRQLYPCARMVAYPQIRD